MMVPARRLRKALLRHAKPVKTAGLVLAVVMFAVVAWKVQEVYTQKRDDWTEAVNVSGRQRMLTQRVALLGLEMAVARQPAVRDSLRRELRAASSHLADQQQDLVEGQWGKPWAQIELGALREFLAPDGGLQRRLASYRSTARAAASTDATELTPRSASVRQLRTSATRLVEDFERQTELFVDAADRELADFRRTALRVFVLTVAGIVGLGLFVILPTLRRLQEETEEQFRTLFEAVPDAVLAVDHDGRIRASNAQVERVLGYDPDELVGRPVHSIVPESMRADHQRHVEQYVEEPEPRPMGVGLDLEAVRADGEAIPVDITLNPTELQGEQLVLAGLRDLTERKRAEEARKKAQLRYRNLFLHASDGLLVVGSDGRIRSANPAAEELLGATPGEEALVGRKLQSFFANSDECHELTMRLRTKGRADRSEATLRTLGDQQRFVEIMGTARSGVDDRVKECQLVIRDVTEDRRETERLEEQALLDPLTDVGNRRLFTDRMEHAVERARRTGEPLTVVLFDLDDFKPINDRYGHPFGDQVLRVIASRLSGQLRDADTVARIGGDEFALLLERNENIDWIRARLRECLIPPVQADGRSIQVTASVGISRVREGNASELLASPESLMRAADRALYRAKGRSGTAFEFVGLEVRAESRQEDTRPA